MGIQLQGNAGTIAEVDGTGMRALRVTPRPVDPGALGAYRASMITGAMAAGLAANAEVFQFRWTDATRLCVITKVQFDGLGSIVAFAAGFAAFRGIVARSFTASGTGGTAATLTGNNLKQRTSHGTTLAGDIRIASTAALGAGTKTLDAQAFGAVVNGLSATAGIGISEGAIFDANAGGGYPLVLAQNEGFAVQATVPATGTWTAGFTVEWTEVTAY
jgi:hypothetical protein